MESFESFRPRLFGIAYRMLGSAMEAEDIIQEAYLRVHDRPDADVHAPKAFLSRVVTRLCLDELKTARARREQYVGAWLPEPVLTTPGVSERLSERESLSLAFLLLLETLSPTERAVFVLHEVFDYGYAEIAVILDKSEATCRQILHRARQHVASHRSRFTIDSEMHRHLLDQFLQAVAGGDLDGLVRLLSEDVVSLSDGGGQVSTATRPISGSDHVARFMIGLGRKIQANMTLEIALINGAEGLIIRERHHVFSVILLEVADDRIVRVYLIRNPHKLRLPVLQE